MLIIKRVPKVEKKSIKEDLKSIKDEPVTNDIDNKCRVKLTVSKSTKQLVLDCIPEFLIHHPEMEGMKMTENFITRQIAMHYKRTP